MLIICRFMGMAMKTPSTAKKNVHQVRTGHGIWWPVTMRYAATAETMALPVE